jgi:hypothetical protein
LTDGELREEKELNTLNLITALHNTWSTKATDGGDKIFSIRGLLKEEDRKALKVDYFKTYFVE